MVSRVVSPVTLRLRRKAYQCLAVQVVVVFCVALFAAFWGLRFTYSAVLGGACVLIPGALFIVILFRTASAHEAKRIVSRMYAGATVKLLFCAILAAVFARYAQPNMVPFWIGFVGAQLGHWLSPWVISMDVTK